MSSFSVKHFSTELQQYLIASSEVNSNRQYKIETRSSTWDIHNIVITSNSILRSFPFRLKIFVWTGGSFSLHQSLGLQDITTAIPFRRGSSNLQLLAVCRNRTSSVCLIYQWNNERFQNPQTLPVNTRVKQVESFQMGGDTFLLIVTEGNNHTQSVVLLQFNSIFNLKMF